MKTVLTKPLAGFLVMIFLGSWSEAQDKKETITVEITKEVNGEKKTFKKVYGSEEEMQADKELQEFAGEDGPFGFRFQGPHDMLPPGLQPNFHSDFQPDSNAFFFRFDDEEAMGPFRMLREHDSMLKEMEARMRRFHRELRTHLEEFYGEDAMRSFRLDDDTMEDSERIESDSNATMRKLRPGELRELERIERHHRKKMHGKPDKHGKLNISPVEGDEFGKKGIVSQKEQLEVPDLDFYPNPSNGKFNLAFTVPHEDRLAIRIYDTSGEEIYSRYFERFGGWFSERIDLSAQAAGIYLLEIQNGKKRLTRKIVIN